MTVRNAVKAKWRDGRVTHGAWLSIPSAFSAEIMAHQGYDWLCIDMQHGLADYHAAVAMIQAINTTDTVPFVRVSSNDFATINRMLDAGALGIIVPLVNNAADAAAAVFACRYHPRGGRSYGPTRASIALGADYFERANDEVACIPMVETKQALDGLDEILAVPGVDAIYVGPADLSITLGQKPRPDNEGAFEQARLTIAAACAKRGIVAGIHANAGLAAKHEAAGYRMITISSDVVALAASAQGDLRAVRGGR